MVAQLPVPDSLSPGDAVSVAKLAVRKNLILFGRPGLGTFRVEGSKDGQNFQPLAVFSEDNRERHQIDADVAFMRTVRETPGPSATVAVEAAERPCDCGR